MKYILIILLLIGCSKDKPDPTPSAYFISVIKVNPGSISPSNKITYSLSNLSTVTEITIVAVNGGFTGANSVVLPLIPGTGVAYDYHNFNSSSRYYFVIKTNTTQITTPTQTFYF